MQISVNSTTEDSATFFGNFSALKLVPKRSRLIVNIYVLNLTAKAGDDKYEKVTTIEVVAPINDKVIVNDLDSGRMYRFNFALEHGADTHTQTLYASTKISQFYAQDEYLHDSAVGFDEDKARKAARPKSGMCQSENVLYRAALTANINSNYFRNEAEIKKQLLDARKTKDTAQYINTSYKFARPPENRKTRFQRTLLVARGAQALEEIYDFKEGHKFMKNDWFMGPFYSHDVNARAMRKKE